MLHSMTWILAILALGILVVVHEFGHFLVARWCGMRVEVFSIGFGPQIPGCRWIQGETEFLISWIPLGGYVKIAGSNPYDEEDYDPEDETAYLNQPVLKRMAVVVAGPAINYLFAIVVALLLFGINGIPLKPARHPLILARVDRNRGAAKAGLVAGDRIVAVDGRKLKNYYDYKYALSMYLEGCRHVVEGKRKVDLTVMRGTEQTTVTVPVLEKSPGLGLGIEWVGAAGETSFLGVFVPATRDMWVTRVDAKTARDAGLKVGDRIVEVDGHPTKSAERVSQHLRRVGNGYRCPKQMERAVVLTIRRKSGGTREIKVFPDRRGMIGVVFKDVTVWEDAPLRERGWWALQYPARKSYEMLSALKVFFGKLFGGAKGATSQIAGPVGIVVAIKTQIRQGFIHAISVIMFLSVMLGLFNILPIPALDGGHLVFRIVELVTRKRLRPETEGRIHQIALMALLVIFVLVTVKDCRYLFGV